MDDKIFINDIEIFAKHGVSAAEKLKQQRFSVSVCVELDGTSAKISDEIAHTINYSELLSAVINAVESSSFNLIERLSKHIAGVIFSRFQLAISAIVTIKKFPDSIAGKHFSSIGFSSTFFRDEEQSIPIHWQ